MQNRESIEEFIHSVQHLHEIEYGDFKRKLNLYLSRLEQNVGNADSELSRWVGEMKNQILYCAPANIEVVREQTLNSAQKLKNSLH